MCGILGGIGARRFEWLDDDPARLERAIATLRHRGPDGSGSHRTLDGRGFLGHTRLAIIDLEGGHQPIPCETERRRLVFNGEIYNHRALRDQLQGGGHRFRSASDGEVALHLAEDDPTGFMHALHGMFAIAILDSQAATLTLVRDRHGIKPLHVWHDETHLLFGSELKAVLALMDAPPPISSHALGQYLRWKYIPPPLSIYDGVSALPPGGWLTASLKGERLVVEQGQWWTPDFDGPAIVDESEAVERLDATLREVVREHLESDVEIGALLSGGVDSSLIVALASQLGERRIKTFTVGFDRKGFDHSPFARTLAERYGTEHHDEQIDLDPLAALPQLVEQFDEPFGDSSALACFRVSQVASRHVKVALTGDGGDECFAGYKLHELAWRTAPRDAPLRRRMAQLAFGVPAALFSPEAKFLRGLRAATVPPRLQHESRRVMLHGALARRLLGPAHRDATGPDLFDAHRRAAEARGWGPLQTAQSIDLAMMLPGQMLTKVDRTSMACSLECRVPLLDHRVTSLAASLDPTLKIHAGQRKYLLKKVAERYVPPELLYRKKQGFQIPIKLWLKEQLLDEVARELTDGAAVRHGLLSADGVAWILRAQRRRWINLSTPLWALLFLEFWTRSTHGRG